MDTLYRQVEQAIRQHAEYLNVGNGVTESDVRHAICWVMRDNPDIFWFVHQYHFDKDNGVVSFRYRCSPERSAIIQESINDVVEKDFQINYVRTLTQLEQITYVYKWLLTYCNYNFNSAYNQSIDSVFVRRNSVCTGYAKAAQYLFKLLGNDSRLVFGRLNNDKEEGRHCWNIVCIEGRYYHLDICLGDLSLEDVLKEAGATTIRRYGDYNYNCFCVSTDEVLKTRTIEDIETLPICDKNLSSDVVERLSQIDIKERNCVAGCVLAQNGSSADIFLCTKDKNVVLKKFRGNSTKECEEEYDYMDSLKGCKHLLQLNDTYSDVGNNILAMEQLTPIVDLFCSHYYHPTLIAVLMMIRDITLGWMECRQHGILYRDIHICNIYKANDGTYKLGDFGSCTYEQGGSKERVGSPWFMSPESYINGQFDECSAVYSITAVLYFVLNGMKPPFVDGNNEEEALKRKMNGEALPEPVLLHSFPKDFKEVIMKEFLAKGCAFSLYKRIQTCKELLRVIDLLRSSLKSQKFELRFVQQDTETILDNKTIPNVYIPRDIHHRFAYGEEVEIVALTVGCPSPQGEFENVATTPVLMMINTDSDGITGDDVERMSETEIMEMMDRMARAGGGPMAAPSMTTHSDSDGVTDGDVELYSLTQEPQEVLKDGYQCADDVEKLCQTTMISDSLRPEISCVDHCTTFKPALNKAMNGNECDAPSSVVSKIFGGIIGSMSAPIRFIAGGMVSGIGVLFRGRDNGKTRDRNISHDIVEVYSSIFAPAEVKPKSHMLVQIYLHLFEETEKVKTLAQESDKDAERRDYIPLQCKLKKGNKVDVLLNIYGETLLMSDKKSVIWQGSFTKCSFDYFVPKDIEVGELSCVAMLTVNGIPVGEMRFITRIVDAPRQLNPEIIAHKYNKVFISYSHQDESKVKFLHEGLAMGGVPHFFDRSYLKPGDIFPLVIQDYINSADLFILCWSENAAQSEYVKKERVLALERAYPKVQDGKLLIYPMNIEPRAELPADMKEYYHFGEI